MIAKRYPLERLLGEGGVTVVQGGAQLVFAAVDCLGDAAPGISASVA